MTIIDSELKARQKKTFVETNEKCPVCEEFTKYKYIKPKLYMEQDQDVDLRPKKVKWFEKNLDSYNPRLLYIQHCTKCYFAASNAFFKEPLKDYDMSMIRFKKKINNFKSDNPKSEEVIKELIQNINPIFEEINFFESLKLHLLAIYNFQMVDDIAKREAFELGRYSLRLAWLYRDIYENEEKKNSYASNLEELLKNLKKHWADIPDNEDLAIKMALNYYQTTYESSRMIKSLYEEVLMLMLLTRLNVRLENMTEASRTIMIAKDKVREYDNKAKAEQKKMSSQPDSEAYKKASEVVGEARKMNRIIDEVNNIFMDHREQWIKKQIALAKKIIEENKGTSTAEIKEILLKQGIDQTNIDRVIEVRPKKRRRGFFSFFRY
ncbi:MAG: DUF2225 domain-containing protein [Desulfobacterales bacterium]|nr:DUF2225 domain-containing protein [Desulfobacterales bacterium]